MDRYHWTALMMSWLNLAAGWEELLA